MKLGIWIAVVLILLVGAGLVLDVGHECYSHRRFTTFWPTQRRHCGSVERSSWVALKTLASAQAYFKANDSDGDGKNRFWRADVAGLYALAPGGGPAIKLIELSVAAADERPVTDLSAYGERSPKAGYWYRAIRHAEEDPKKLDPDRFAFCAYPDIPRAGQYLYVIDENYTIFRTLAKDRRGVDVFPTDEELRTLWSKAD